MRQVLTIPCRLTESQVECNPENVSNKIVTCPKEDLREYFDDDAWACFVNLLEVKERVLSTCPVCGELDDEELKMIGCDGDGCEQWYHFACVGISSRDNPEFMQWLCVKCKK